MQRAGEGGTEEPRPTEVDVWPLVVRHNTRNTADNQEAHLRLIQVARECCSPAMFAFLFRIRRRLPALIDDVWLWEEIDDHVVLSNESREDALLAGMTRPCRCGGQWMSFVQGTLQANRIDGAELAHDIHSSLVKGRCETVPTLVLAGLHGGEGKSLLLAPLPSLLGDQYVQEGVASGSFPLIGLENKKDVILNEWKFNNSVLPLTTQLVWFEGKAVPISRPQGTDAYYGHCKYRGTAPIFITAAMKWLQPLMQEAENARLAGTASELTMVMRRLKVYEFTQRSAAPARQIAPCAHCFAQFVLQGEAACCTRGA